MIHQPMGGVSGQTTDIQIHAKEIVNVKNRLNKIISDHTPHTPEKVAKDPDRDLFLTAAEALEYGLIDDIITQKEKSFSDARNRCRCSHRFIRLLLAIVVFS